MIRLEEYIDKNGNNLFSKWFNNLNSDAAGKIAIVLVKLESGNFSNVDSVGAGVNEYKLDYGPGYRVYFGKDGKELIILLGGGTKKRQSNDIEIAKELWKEYKKEKKLLQDKKKGKKKKINNKKKR